MRRYTRRHMHELCCMCTWIHTQRLGWDSGMYPVTVQVWIVTTAEAIWHLLYGYSDAVLWLHYETLAQAAWTTCLITFYHLFWMLYRQTTPTALFIYIYFFYIKIHHPAIQSSVVSPRTVGTRCLQLVIRHLTRYKLCYQTSLWYYRLELGIMAFILYYSILHPMLVPHYVMSWAHLHSESHPSQEAQMSMENPTVSFVRKSSQDDQRACFCVVCLHEMYWGRHLKSKR